MRLTTRLAAVAMALSMPLAMTACESAPENPTWLADVAPILQANCVKCHGRVPRGGAPSTFRLDVLSGGGVYGPQILAPFLAERAHQGTMPPVRPLADIQIDTLRNWAATGAEPGSPNPSNQLPEIQISGFLGDSTITMPYVISDPDFDIVEGTLTARLQGQDTEITITNDLHSGVGEATWFAAGVAEGIYDIRATLNDGHIPRIFELGRFVVAHENGNTAPTISVGAPAVGQILSDNLSPVDVKLNIADPEAADTADVTVSLVRGDERIELATAADLPVGETILSVDTTALPEGPNWTLVVESGVSVTRVPNLVVSHTTTNEVFTATAGGDPSVATDIQVLLGTYCDPCHGTNSTVDFPLRSNFGGLYTSIAGNTSGAYRRAILERSMPPKSAETLFDGYEPMPEAERARLAEWLEAGAPEGEPPPPQN